MAALHSRCGHYIFALWFLLLSSFFFPRLISAVADWMSTILLHMVCLSADLGCRSGMCCMRLPGNAGRKNNVKNRHLGTIAQLVGLCLRNESVYRQSEKNLLSSSTISSTCSCNLVNFGPLTAEIGLGVWGTPANFNGFRVLAALLHGTLVVRVSQTAALNRGRHLYSAGRPSRWAFTYILLTIF